MPRPTALAKNNRSAFDQRSRERVALAMQLPASADSPDEESMLGNSERKVKVPKLARQIVALPVRVKTPSERKFD